MRSQSYQQFAIVQCDSASAFEGELNERIRELTDKNPVVKFDGLTAYISYTESVKIPESLSDEYEMEGIVFRCEQCPEFEPILNKDGSENKVVKYGECQFASMGRTYKNSRACELCYQMIRDGRIGLCYRK